MGLVQGHHLPKLSCLTCCFPLLSSRLQADICQLGMDQRKVNMLAREYCDDCKPKRLKPVILSHAMMPGLLEVGGGGAASGGQAGGHRLAAGGQLRGQLHPPACLCLPSACHLLLQGQEKMGKSNPNSAIPLTACDAPLPCAAVCAGPGEDEQERPQLRDLHGGQRAGGEDQDQKGVLPPAAGGWVGGWVTALG